MNNLENLIIYGLSVWFFVYIIKYSNMFSRLKNKVKNEKIEYLLNCSFCLSFWMTFLVFTIVGPFPFDFFFAIPVINLFLDKLFLSIK